MEKMAFEAICSGTVRDRYVWIIIYGLLDRTVWSAITHDGDSSWITPKIPELYGKIHYYNVYLSKDGGLLTASRGLTCKENYSLVMQYHYLQKPGKL